MGHADHYEQAERLLYAAEQAARDAGAHLAAEALLATDAQIVPLTPRNATGLGGVSAQADD